MSKRDHLHQLDNRVETKSLDKYLLIGCLSTKVINRLSILLLQGGQRQLAMEVSMEVMIMLKRLQHYGRRKPR